MTLTRSATTSTWGTSRPAGPRRPCSRAWPARTPSSCSACATGGGRLATRPAWPAVGCTARYNGGIRSQGARPAISRPAAWARPAFLGPQKNSNRKIVLRISAAVVLRLCATWLSLMYFGRHREFGLISFFLSYTCILMLFSVAGVVSSACSSARRLVSSSVVHHVQQRRSARFRVH